MPRVVVAEPQVCPQLGHHLRFSECSIAVTFPCMGFGCPLPTTWPAKATKLTAMVASSLQQVCLCRTRRSNTLVMSLSSAPSRCSVARAGVP